MKTTGMSALRAASSSRRIASIVSSSSHTSGEAGSVKPLFMSMITSAGRRPTPPPRCPKPSNCVPAHGYTASRSRTRARVSAPSSSGDQRSGFAGVGGSSPVSALQFASASSSGGPKSKARASPRSPR